LGGDEDIALIRTAFETWDRGDVDGFFELVHPEVEWVPPSYAPEPGPHRGHAEVRRGIAAYFEGFEEFRPRLGNVRAASEPGTYLAEVSAHTKGKGSGLEWDIDVFHLITVRDGKLAGLAVFTDKAEALEAAGLSEDA
jgi:ketosteroid isomerase-like protein